MLLHSATRRYGSRLAVLCACAALWSGCGGGGGTSSRSTELQPNATVPPVQDVYVAEDQPGVNFNSNTANCGTCGSMLTIMSSSNTTYERHVLLKYDLSGLPAGSGRELTIIGAELHIEYLGGTGTNTDDDVTFRAYRCDKSWSENGVNWSNKPNPTGSSLGSVLVKGTRFDTYLPINAATVQGWLDSPATNYGIMLIGTGGNGIDSCKTMPSREYSGRGITLDLSYTSN